MSLGSWTAITCVRWAGTWTTTTATSPTGSTARGRHHPEPAVRLRPDGQLGELKIYAHRASDREASGLTAVGKKKVIWTAEIIKVVITYVDCSGCMPYNRLLPLGFPRMLDIIKSSLRNNASLYISLWINGADEGKR
jgi:hypothetical protein